MLSSGRWGCPSALLGVRSGCSASGRPARLSVGTPQPCWGLTRVPGSGLGSAWVSRLGVSVGAQSAVPGWGQHGCPSRGPSVTVTRPGRVTYVYYEQYLTVVAEGVITLALCLVPTFVVSFLLLGMDLRSSVATLLTIAMILLDTVGAMTLWDVPYNAVALINLVAVRGDAGIWGTRGGWGVQEAAEGDGMYRVTRGQSSLGDAGWRRALGRAGCTSTRRAPAGHAQPWAPSTLRPPRGAPTGAPG